jgi:hypothetical protein
VQDGGPRRSWRERRENKKLERKERQAAKSHAAQIIKKDGKTGTDQQRKLARSVEPKVAAWKQWEIKWRLEKKAAKRCDENGERGTAEAINLERLRVASSFSGAKKAPNYYVSERGISCQVQEVYLEV